MKIPNKLSNILSNQSGFTLIELVVSISITAVVTTISLQILGNTQKEFSQDTNNLDKSQKRTSLLELIGRDIRQAGEQIEEPRFPVIKVFPNTANPSGGDSLVMYRAIATPLTLCNTNTVTTGTSVSSWPMSSTDASVINSTQECRANSVVAPQIYPPNLQEWSDNREAARNFGVIHNKLGSVQAFTMTNQTETPANSKIYRISNTTFISAFNIERGMSAYLVEKKEYLVCDKKLYMRLNSFSEGECLNGTNDNEFQLISSNIDEMRLDISLPKIDSTTGSELVPAQTEVVSNTIFPPAALTPATQNYFWRNIQLIKVKLKSTPEAYDCKDLSGPACTEKRKKLIAESSFYPRNVMSSKTVSSSSPSPAPSGSPGPSFPPGYIP
jgi:prepilin-type N-terminal cleavage/methylation domain-containing protein